jgi:hypothetical protein
MAGRPPCLRHFLLYCVAALWCGIAAAQPAPLRLVATIELPGVGGRLDHLAYAADRNLLFVAALGADTVEVVDVNARRRLRRITGVREPQGLAYAPGLGLFVASGRDDRLLRLDGDALHTLTPDLPDADNLRLDASASRLYVGYGKALAAVDARTGAVLQRFELPGHPEAFEVSGNRIYVNVPGVGAVLVLDRLAGKAVARWPVGFAPGNFAMALDGSTSRLFVASRRPPELLVFGTDTGEKGQAVPLCADVDDLALDPSQHALYAVCGDGHVHSLDTQDGSHLQLRQAVTTAPGARTGLWVQELHALFIAAPARGTRSAAILVYEAR